MRNYEWLLASSGKGFPATQKENGW